MKRFDRVNNPISDELPAMSNQDIEDLLDELEDSR